MPDATTQCTEACDACAAGSATLDTGVASFFGNLLNTDGFPPRWECGTGWTAGHGWLHISSDFMIFGAYFAIPLVLVYFIHRRKDVPYPPILWLFVSFIAVCGVGHLIEATIFWTPWYRLSAVLKCLTAIISWITVVALVKVLPMALRLPGLATINRQLEQEVTERKATEAELYRQRDELQVFTRSIIEREERMIALKEEVNELLAELGRSEKYTTELDETLS